MGIGSTASATSSSWLLLRRSLSGLSLRGYLMLCAPHQSGVLGINRLGKCTRLIKLPGRKVRDIRYFILSGLNIVSGHLQGYENPAMAYPYYNYAGYHSYHM